MTGEKPEPVGAYRCPKCKVERIWGDEVAQAHVDIEPDTPLPKGLIFLNHDIGGWLTVIADDGRINSEHGYTHGTLRSAWYSFERKTVDSREFKEKLRRGDYSLAKPEKMDYYNSVNTCSALLHMVHIEEFVRSTPELEAIVAEAKEEKKRRELIRM